MDIVIFTMIRFVGVGALLANGLLYLQVCQREITKAEKIYFLCAGLFTLLLSLIAFCTSCSLITM